MYKKRLIATLVSIFALGVVFGILVVEHDTFSLRALFIALAAISVLFIIASRHFQDKINYKRVSAVAFAVAAFSFGVLRVTIYNEFGVKTSDLDNRTDSVEFKIYDVNTYYVDAYVVSSEMGVQKGELVRVYSDVFKEGIVAGDIFYADVRYNFNDSPSNLADGISLTASADIKEYIDGRGLLYIIRKSVSENSLKLFDAFEYAPSISKAVVVGDRSSLDSYIFSLYKTSGLSHVLAISGLHITLFSLNLYALLMMLGFNPKFVCIFSSLTAIGYSALVGFTFGSVRAATMFVFLMIFRLFFRRSDGVTALFISLALLLVVNPYSICSVGMQLSYLCSLGIILSQPILSHIRTYFGVRIKQSYGIKAILYRIPPAIITPLIITFSSTVFSFPIICTQFDTVSYISPLMNLFAVTLFSYAIGFALVSFLLAPLYLPLAKIVAFPAGLVFDLITDISRWMHEAEIGTMSAHSPYMFIPVALSLVMIGTLVFLSKYKIRVFVSFAVLFCVSLYACWLFNNNYTSEKMIMEYSYNSGEYVYCQTPTSNAYIDIGGYSSNPSAIYKNGLIALDKYIVLDYNKYSLKRFDRLCGNMNIGALYLPEPQNSYEMKIYLQIKELANSRNCDIIDYNGLFETTLTDEFDVQIYNEPEQTVIYASIMDKSVRFIGGSFNEGFSADVAVAMSDYNGDQKHIEAYQVYASEDYLKSVDGAEQHFSAFKDTIRIEMHNRERQLKIYEP